MERPRAARFASPATTFEMKTATLICLCASLALGAGAPSEKESTASTLATSQKCAPGSSEYDGCNTCVCLKDGSAKSCTKKKCEPTPEPGPAVAQDEPCNPGEYIGLERCVPCECVRHGSEEICTKKSCEGEGATKASEGATKRAERATKSGGGEMICKPGHSESDGCNTCVCNSEGSAKECTKQICS